jgi:transposase
MKFTRRNFLIITKQLVTDFEIKTVKDLYKLKPLMEGTSLKINKSEIARELNVDRRTVSKYINGFKKSKTRQRTNALSSYHKIIHELLSPDNPQVFYYKHILYLYLKDNHNYKGSYRTFCECLLKVSEFNDYFKKKRPSNVNQVTVRYETAAGKQAQLDWKESIDFLLSNGDTIKVNVFVLLLSYSRFRVYYLSLTKTQDILLNFLDSAFEVFGGVPGELVTDNMKTVMDDPRTSYSKGKPNTKFAQFAKDYGFKIKPCIVERPKTKGKVESPMRLLDEIRAYNGQLDYDGLTKLVQKMNDRKNSEVVQGTGIIPIMFLKKEKSFLHPLPAESIRKTYKITSKILKVNNFSMITCRNCQYSVPVDYVGKYLTVQIYDDYLHVYDSTKLIALHEVSNRKLNYLQSHYEQIATVSNCFRTTDIPKMAKENLKLIGKIYDNK